MPRVYDQQGNPTDHFVPICQIIITEGNFIPTTIDNVWIENQFRQLPGEMSLSGIVNFVAELLEAHAKRTGEMSAQEAANSLYVVIDEFSDEVHALGLEDVI